MIRFLWKRKNRPIFFRVLIYAILFQVLLMAFMYRRTEKPEEPIFRDMDTTNNYMNVCSLPVYDYWHPDAMRHISEGFNPTFWCDRSFKPYTQLVNGTWSIVEERNGTDCKARCFKGKGDYEVDTGDWFPPGPVDCEFLEAVCWEGDEEIYGYIHTQIVPKPQPTPKHEDPPSVFVFLFDSLSMGQAKRSFHKTLSFISRRLEAVEFPFVNKVGENSLPNGLALWFGKMIEGVNDEMFGGRIIYSEWTEEEYCRTHLTNESIFKDYTDHGYMTVTIDDWASQMVNYPNCKGFSEPPTHHYMHPFQMMNAHYGTDKTKKHIDGHLCREEHQPPLEYLQQFIDAYKGRPMFSWLWLNTLSHDDFNGLFRMNQPMIDLLEKNMELFENSFFILLGDHGYRTGKRDFRRSEIGRLEINNPYLSISIPKKLRKNPAILETLRQNSRRLQTHFDTRATLLDIIKFQPESNFGDRSVLDIPGEKGHSLLRSQPRTPRTCGTLPIPHQYCICQIEKVPVNDENLKQRLGIRLIDHVNKMLQTANFSSICEKFELREVTLLEHYGHTNHSTPTHNYEIIVMAEAPSFAQFHTTIVQNKETNKLAFGTFFRLDKYGDTGDCAKNRDFEKMCFCKNLTTSERWRHRLWNQWLETAHSIENALPALTR